MAYTVNSYKDKYIGVDGRLSVYDILQKVGTTEYRDGEFKKYEAVGIDYVKIGGNTFRNYGQIQFIWEKTFVKSPERSADGSIGNLNSYATFLTPHLILNFSIMSIDDYRQIMRMHYEANEYTVECYDPIYNHPIKVKMYFATEEMAKLYTIAQNRLLDDGRWEEWVDLVGVTEYNVELIGTNNDLSLLSVTYHLNPPSSTGVADKTEGEQDVYKGEELIIGGASTFPNETFGGAYKFKKWNVSPDGGVLGNYINGYAYTINTDLVLYAQWEETKSHTLTFNYGLADEIASQNPDQYPTQRNVVYGKSIGEIPVAPYIEVEGEYLSPYENGAWYKTPTKASNSVPVKSGDLYWLERDSSIYLIYDTRGYTLQLEIKDAATQNWETYQSNFDVKYNSALNLPNLVKNGYTFDGWYTFSDFREGTKYTQTTMPAHDLTLYARWIKN